MFRLRKWISEPFRQQIATADSERNKISTLCVINVDMMVRPKEYQQRTKKSRDACNATNNNNNEKVKKRTRDILQYNNIDYNAIERIRRGSACFFFLLFPISVDFQLYFRFVSDVSFSMIPVDSLELTEQTHCKSFHICALIDEWNEERKKTYRANIKRQFHWKKHM